MINANINERFITGRQTFRTLEDRIAGVVEKQGGHPFAWFVVLGVAFMFVQIMMLTVTWLLYKGVGIWGINIPVGWGFDIINFVWWIGIGHAGTLISAILLLMRQRWRNSINRFAEAMTIFAVMCAAMYPLLHTGRPWTAYWMFPYPNVLGMWPQFKSPLIWDVFAINTYLLTSVLFWWLGLIPDFAIMRDRVKKPGLVKYVWGMLAMGWHGSARHWFRYETAYLILAGLSTPLVLSVHTIVSFDFAVSIVPGWHTTIFPPYFVAGAIYAGFAMVLTLAIPVRAWYGLKDVITLRHIDWMAKFTLATGMVVFYGYLCEIFYSWYSGNTYEVAMILNRFKGPYAPLYWVLLTCNGVIPQLLWWNKVRKNIPMLFCVSMIVSVGMWLERFIIIPASLHRDFLPSSWGLYIPTIWDWGMFLGTIGFFVFMMFLFVRFVPMINMFEMKDLLHKQEHQDHAHPHGAPAEVAAAAE